MEGPINMNGQPIFGLNDPTEDTQAARKGYVDASVRKAAPRNLLDNSDFRNPVNQRGITVCNVGSYGLDRWIHVDGSFSGTVSITIDANGTTFNTSDGTDVGLIQRFIDKNYYDGKYTAAIKTGDGSILIGAVRTENAEAHMQQASFWFPIGTTVVWAALYAGEYTAATLPEYHPKGYGAELAECQRYLRIVGAQMSNANINFGYAQVATQTVLNACIAIGDMRIMAPSYTLVGNFVVRKGVTDVSANITGMSVQNGVAYIQLSASGLKAGDMYAMRFVDGGHLIISADL